MNGAPNCYLCAYRKPIAGDAHSMCDHPDADPIGLIAVMSFGRATYKTGLTVAGDPQAVRAGWFMWPMNFDPVWLVECNGFKQEARQ